MDVLLEIEQSVEKPAMNLFQAGALSLFITATTVLGISIGKHMDKTVSHIEIPSIHYAARTSRRIEDM